MFRVALRLLLAAALGAVPALVRADVYRWVDDAGDTHYSTTRDAVPRRYRDEAEVIKPPPTGILNPSGARPPAPPAPPPAAEPTPAPLEPPPPAISAPPSAPAVPEPPAPAPAPESESQSSAPVTEPVGPPAAPPPVSAPAAPRAPGDPREAEIAELEGQIERDRESLRQLISTPRWDSAELASDPRVREIAERLPRLQAELAALRTEAER